MNGLQQIIDINKHEALRREDVARRNRGQKPSSRTGEVLRTVAARRPLTSAAGPKIVYAQGRQVALA